VGAGELSALAIMVTGLAIGAFMIGRLLDRVERAIKLIEQGHELMRHEMQRLDERVDETHRMLGRLGVIEGGKGGRG